MAMLSKARYRFNTAPLKLPRAFFAELEQKTLKFVCRNIRPLTALEILKKKIELEESGSLTSDYTTKLQSSKQYVTATKTEA